MSKDHLPIQFVVAFSLGWQQLPPSRHTHQREAVIKEYKMSSQNYKDIAVNARKRREAAIPAECLLPMNKLENLPQDITSVPRDSWPFHAWHDENDVVESDAEVMLKNIRDQT